MKTIKFTVSIELPDHMADFITSMIADNRAPWVILEYVRKHASRQNCEVQEEKDCTVCYSGQLPIFTNE